jgi:hypothetical protein
MRFAAIAMSMAVFCFLAAGCGLQSDKPMGYLAVNENQLARASEEAPATSLFKADQAVLSNEDIEKILSAKVYPPMQGRVAMIRVGGRYGTRWGQWSEQVAQLDQQTTADLLGKVRSSKRVSDALLLPTLLQPAQATIPYLREAAARVQGDTLLIYRTFSQTYQVQRVFGSDDVRAYCTAEAVLLDTRTGIVTYTSVASEPFSAHKTSKEVTFEETVALAEQQAASRALGKVGDEVSKFLNEAPAARNVPKAEP